MGWEVRKLPCGCCKHEMFIEGGKVKKVKLGEDLNLNCPKVWDLFKKGLTYGVFQLETGLGQSYSKRFLPQTIEDLGTLLAVIRPGCLDAIIDEKSVTRHICDRRNGKEQTSYMHPETEKVTKETNGYLVFQEQCIKLAQDLAGLTGEEGDSLRKCVSGDTCFTTENTGPEKISDLYRDGRLPKIWSCDAKGKKELKKLRKIWKSGSKELLKITTKSGFSVKVSKDHKVFTNYGWVEAQNISKEKHSVVVQNESTYRGIFKNCLPNDLCEFYGYFLSEGCTVHNSCKVTNSDPWINARIDKILADNNIRTRKQYSENGCVDTNILGEDKNKIYTDFPKVKSALKAIPKNIMRAPREGQIRFIAAFFSGDGSARNKHSVNTGSYQLNFHSTSPTIAKQIQQILMRFGVRSSLVCLKNNKYKKDNYYSYNVSICRRPEAVKFFKIFGNFICPEKREKIEHLINKKYTAGYSSETVPKNIIKSIVKNVNLSSLSDKTLGGGVYNSNLTYDRAQYINNMIGSDFLQEILDADHKYHAIASIEPCGTEEVYDFSMEDETCPWAYGNFILVHNCIGKKIPELMEKMKEKFMEGCKKNPNITKEEAERIFAGIEASQRYAFNKSHSIGYALNSYIFSAYIKAHFPRAFYIAKMKFAKDNKKIGAIIDDSIKLGIRIRTPSLKWFNPDPMIHKKDILFPLAKIKSVSEGHIEQIKQNLQEGWTWQQWLFEGFKGVNKTAASNLIRSGAMDFLAQPRAKMLETFVAYREVTQKPLKKVLECCKDPIEALESAIEEGVGKDKPITTEPYARKFKQLLNLFKMANEKKDSINVIAKWEKDLLGREMTFTELDSSKVPDGTITCLDWIEGRGLAKEMKFPLILNRVSEFTTKKEEIMCFLEGYDITGSASDIVVFPKIYSQFKGLIYEGNKVILTGTVSNNSFQVKGVEQI